MSGNPLHVRLSDLFRDRVGVLLALLVLLFPVAKGASAAVALWQYVRARQAGTAGPWPRELRTGALLILAAFVVGMIFTVDFDYTFRAFLSVVLALTFVWGVRRYAAFGDGRLQPAFLAAAVLLLLGALSVWLYWQWQEGPFLVRMHGIAPFKTRNLWSCSLALTWVAVFAVLLRNDLTVRHGRLAMALLLVATLLLVANATIEALIAACAAAAVMLALRFPTYRLIALVIMLAALTVLLMVVIPAADWSPGLWMHDDERSNRLLLWQTTGELIRQRPWAGYGPGTFKYSEAVNALLPVAQQHPASPHNWALEILYSFGVTGTVLYLGGLALLARALRRSFVHHSAYLRLVGAGFLAVILVNGLVDFRAFGLFFQCTLLASGYLVLAFTPALYAREQRAS